jgi:hypothetical protein
MAASRLIATVFIPATIKLRTCHPLICLLAAQPLLNAQLRNLHRRYDKGGRLHDRGAGLQVGVFVDAEVFCG